MNNANIIIQAALNAGFYTESEMEALLEEGKMPEFHTYAIWKQMGLCPRKGTHGYETRLWRKKDKKSDINEEEVNEEERNCDFYLTKAFLFHISQCEPITISSDQAS